MGSQRKLKKHKSKTDHEEQKKDKGKSRVADSEFANVNATLVVSIAPVFASDPRTGVEEMLDSMVMRYIPAFRGVVLAHSNLLFLNNNGLIKGDCPYINCPVSFDATVWSPRVGMKLVGKINLCSPDHIALLVHRTFNASIPRHHIRVDEWEFEYSLLVADNGLEEEAALDGDGENGSQNDEVESCGQWVHKVTGEKLGGTEGYLEFTVIGLTVANEMLSILGSLQFDPFSPEHSPEKSAASYRSSSYMSEQPFDLSSPLVNEHGHKTKGKAAKRKAEGGADGTEKTKKRKKKGDVTKS